MLHDFYDLTQHKRGDDFIYYIFFFKYTKTSDEPLLCCSFWVQHMKPVCPHGGGGGGVCVCGGGI